MAAGEESATILFDTTVVAVLGVKSNVESLLILTALPELSFKVVDKDSDIAF